MKWLARLAVLVAVTGIAGCSAKRLPVAGVTRVDVEIPESCRQSASLRGCRLDEHGVEFDCEQVHYRHANNCGLVKVRK